MKALINGKIITEEEVLNGRILILNENIVDIISDEDFSKARTSGLYEDIEIIDAKGNYISPGFIDLHIHGSKGSDTMDGELEAIKVISSAIAQNGVTAFLPTTMTMEKDKIYKALDSIREAMGIRLQGAQVIGAHLEGPFINEKCKGAQKADCILQPDIDFIKGYEDIIKIITLAPEKDKDFKFIEAVKKNTSIKLSIGHSDASFEEAMEAINKGVSRATHLFNAMSPMNHRKPGVVGAVFTSNVNCEFIADKVHVHSGLFPLVVKIKGKDKVVLITDCMRAGCLKEGISELGGQKVIVSKDSATLENGTLAGSILTINKAVKNIFENTDLEIQEAVALATINPARDIGIHNRKGSIAVGKDADIIIFDDKFSVKQTIVQGNTVYNESII